MSLTYRPDVDGLRAVAVVPVILFHAGLPFFSGGFVGVDIFFVISGYLITSLVLRDLRRDHFSIIEFYERRIRRIFPALYVMLFACLGAAVVLLLPRELLSFAKSLLAATFFYSNYHFMFQNGYFDPAAGTQPLLHMWSLAVEEQFYLILPPYLYLLRRWSPARLRALTGLLLLASCAYSTFLVAARPDDAFFSAPGRAWELLVGSMLALLPATRPGPLLRNACGLGGLVLGIGVPIFLYSETTAFPGPGALPPVLGAALVIWAGSGGTHLVGRALSGRVIRFIGQISYSLYLWHWPVFVVMEVCGLKGEPATLPFELGLTFVLAYLTWRFVETPFRDRALPLALAEHPRLFFVATAAMAATGISAGSLALLDGRTFRTFPPAVERALRAADDDWKEPANCSAEDLDGEQKACPVGPETGAPAKFLLWGDSHAFALVPAIEEAAKLAGVGGFFVGRHGCPPLLGVNQVRQRFSDCSETAAAVLAYAKRQPELETIVLVSRWAIYFESVRPGEDNGEDVFVRDTASTETSRRENQRVVKAALRRTLEALEQMGKCVVMVSQVPETEYDIPKDVARASLWGTHSDLRPRQTDYDARQAGIRALFDELARDVPFTLVEPHRSMCQNGMCEVAASGVPIYRDSNHLTASYARSLAPLFLPALERAGQGAACHGQPAARDAQAATAPRATSAARAP